MESLIEVDRDILQEVAKVIEAGIAYTIINGIFIEPKVMEALTDLCLVAKNERMNE